MAYVYHGTDTYQQDAKRRVLNLASWDPRGPTAIDDQESVYVAWVVALGYDWLGSALNVSEQSQVLSMLSTRIGDLYGWITGANGLPYNSTDVPPPLWQVPRDSHRNAAVGMVATMSTLLVGDLPAANTGCRICCFGPQRHFTLERRGKRLCQRHCVRHVGRGKNAAERLVRAALNVRRSANMHRSRTEGMGAELRGVRATSCRQLQKQTPQYSDDDIVLRSVSSAMDSREKLFEGAPLRQGAIPTSHRRARGAGTPRIWSVKMSPASST
jgi:hypothetical protein